MFVHETTETNRLQDQKLKDKEINEDLNSAKKINLMILGAFFLVISILELLPNFNQTKDLLPFLPLTLLHILIIGLVLGILGYFFLKIDFLILTLILIVFLFL